MLDLLERHCGSSDVPSKFGPYTGYLLDAIPWSQREKVYPSPFDRVVVYDCLQSEHVVRIDPVCDLLFG